MVANAVAIVVGQAVSSAILTRSGVFTRAVLIGGIRGEVAGRFVRAARHFKRVANAVTIAVRDTIAFACVARFG